MNGPGFSREDDIALSERVWAFFPVLTDAGRRMANDLMLRLRHSDDPKEARLTSNERSWLVEVENLLLKGGSPRQIEDRETKEHQRREWEAGHREWLAHDRHRREWRAGDRRAEDGRCRDCGTTEEVTLAPDPFAEEIHDDHAPQWLCARCREENAADL